jgi:hypothetical protein
VLLYPHTAGVDHVLRLKGHMKVFGGGTFQAGTDANPIPITRKFKIEGNYSASLVSGKYGIYVEGYGTFSMVGATLTKIRTKLNADEANGQTELTVVDATGWKQNDVIMIAGTRRAAGEAEQKILANDDEGTGHIDITAATSYTHHGVAPTQADIALLTRNVVLTNYNTTYYTYIVSKGTATTYLKNIEISYVGYNSADHNGVTFYSSTGGSGTLTYCSVHHTYIRAVFIAGSGVNNVTCTYNNICDVNGINAIEVEGTSGTNITISNNLLIKSGNGVEAFQLGDVGITCQNNTVANFQGSVLVIAQDAAVGTISDLTAYCNGTGTAVSGAALNFSTILKTPYTWENFTIWRQNATGIYFGGENLKQTFKNFNIWGNYNSNINWSSVVSDPTFINCNFNSETGYTCAVYFESGVSTFIYNARFYGCGFGVASGTKIASAYLFQTNNYNNVRQIYIIDDIGYSAASGPWDSTTILDDRNFVAIENYNNTPGRHIKWIGDYQATVNIISDHITGGQLAAWAYGGSGIAVLLNPGSTTKDLIWKFNVPVTNATPFVLNIRVRKTAGSPTLSISMKGCGIVEEVNTDIPLTTSWVQYNAASKTPARDGFIEVTLKARDNASSGDIGIDDITIS